MEDITDAYYTHAKTVCKDFAMEKLREHHCLYVQGDTLLLADVFENFRNMCPKMYEIDPANNSFTSWISMVSSFKKDNLVKSGIK